jgi:hypothetical protein
MAEVNYIAINAGSADQSSGPLDTSRLDNLFLQVTAVVTSADLAATIAVGTGIEPGSPASFPAAKDVVAVSTLPAGVTLPSTGLLTFATAAIGTHNIILKLPAPGPVSTVTYDYTSGGGTVSMTVRAFGWKHKT